MSGAATVAALVRTRRKRESKSFFSFVVVSNNNVVRLCFFSLKTFDKIVCLVRERGSLLSPAYGRRVSERAVAGDTILPSSFFSCFPAVYSHRSPCPSSGTDSPIVGCLLERIAGCEGSASWSKDAVV